MQISKAEAGQASSRSSRHASGKHMQSDAAAICTVCGKRPRAFRSRGPRRSRNTSATLKNTVDSFNDKGGNTSSRCRSSAEGTVLYGCERRGGRRLHPDLSHWITTFGSSLTVVVFSRSEPRAIVEHGGDTEARICATSRAWYQVADAIRALSSR